MQKLTYEFIKIQFEKEGYCLLSTQYTNAHTKLDYECPHGHIHSISWAKWSSGRRCAYCSGNIMPNFSSIRSTFDEEGYVLLSAECDSSQSRLIYKCSYGHINSITWNNWQKGKRCKWCAVDDRATKKRTDFEVIKKQFELDNYILLTKIYKNCDQKLQYVCPEGHIADTTWGSWKHSGSRCAMCAYIKNSGSGNYNWKGGISTEPYCDVWADKEYKESIKTRDNHKCQNPVCWGRDTKICLHHIDYNKKNCHPTNLITLCKSCNSRANYDREKHTKFYTKIIKNIYMCKEE